MVLGFASDEFCFSIVTRLKCKPMPPRAVAHTGTAVFILNRGCICADGDLTTSTAPTVCWGGWDFFLERRNQYLVVPVSLMAVTYAELHHFSGPDLREVMEEFPAERTHVQRRMHWCAVLAMIKYMARRAASKSMAGETAPMQALRTRAAKRESLECMADMKVQKAASLKLTKHERQAQYAEEKTASFKAVILEAETAVHVARRPFSRNDISPHIAAMVAEAVGARTAAEATLSSGGCVFGNTRKPSRDSTGLGKTGAVGGAAGRLYTEF
jgi:hypothetical protein